MLWAIVAIPKPDDYVWNLSSQKIPHLTLMVLSESGDAERIFTYLQHAVETSLPRFGMDVSHRGLLGENDADVLFFGQHPRKKLIEFRSFLLANDDIYKAWHEVSQFPLWIPHLTLGFPDDPAKPDTRDYPGTSWVNFDRLALWTGDFEGPEILLPNEDALGDENMSMTVSEEDALLHFGVKGMKWGTRKDSKGSSRKPSGRVEVSPDHSKSESLRKNKRKTLTNDELALIIKRRNLEQQFSNLNPSKVKQGQNVVKAIVATVGTVSSVIALAGSPAGKAAITAAKTVIKNI